MRTTGSCSKWSFEKRRPLCSSWPKRQLRTNYFAECIFSYWSPKSDFTFRCPENLFIHGLWKHNLNDGELTGFHLTEFYDFLVIPYLAHFNLGLSHGSWCSIKTAESQRFTEVSCSVPQHQPASGILGAEGICHKRPTVMIFEKSLYAKLASDGIIYIWISVTKKISSVKIKIRKSDLIDRSVCWWKTPVEIRVA